MKPTIKRNYPAIRLSYDNEDSEHLNFYTYHTINVNILQANIKKITL